MFASPSTPPIRRACLSLVAVCLASGVLSCGRAIAAFANVETVAADEAAEGRERTAKILETKLIAPCCSTQPVAIHYSPAADRIRAEIRRMLAGGATEDDVLDAFVARYGEGILAQPRGRGFGLLAWLLPPLAILSGGIGAVSLLRRWRRAEQEQSMAQGAEPPPQGRDDDLYRERLRADLERWNR
jgi:cytochrome c-type biogenesis protein CcmH